MATVIDDTVLFTKSVAFRQPISFAAGSIGNAAITAAAGIASTKLQQQQTVVEELFGPTTTITALTRQLAMINGGTCNLLKFRASLITVATGADRTVTVDLQRSTAGGAFATVLSATIGFTNGSTARTVVSGTISTAAGVQNDLYQVVVTVAGAAGAQALGLIVALDFQQDPN